MKLSFSLLIPFLILYPFFLSAQTGSAVHFGHQFSGGLCGDNGICMQSPPQAQQQPVPILTEQVNKTNTSLTITFNGIIASQNGFTPPTPPSVTYAFGAQFTYTTVSLSPNFNCVIQNGAPATYTPPSGDGIATLAIPCTCTVANLKKKK